MLRLLSQSAKRLEHVLSPVQLTDHVAPAGGFGADGALKGSKAALVGERRFQMFTIARREIADGANA